MIAEAETGIKRENCIVCGKKLVGRQVSYCGPDCKNLFHGSGKAKSTATIKRIIEILRKNRMAIKTVLGDLRATDSTMKELRDNGYKPEFHTHQKVYGGKTYTYNFEYGFREEGDKLRLVKDHS